MSGCLKLLSKRSYTEMLTPIELGNSYSGYAFGISVNKLPNGHRMISHGGNTTGAATQDARFPDDGLSIIVLANSGTFSYDSAVMAIYGALVPSVNSAKPPVKASVKPKEVDSPNPQFVAEAEHWLDQAVSGNDRHGRPAT